MENKCGVAVIGVGYLGSIHAKIYHEMPDVDLVAVVDPDVQRVSEIASLYGCGQCADITDIIDSVDAVSVVVPTSAHFDVSMPFLERGIHVLLEKPIAPTVEQGQKLVDSAKASGSILQIGHLERFNAGVMRLAELVDQPRFIEVHRLSEFVERATDVDVVTDLMIHDIDIVMTLVNRPLSRVHASGARIITQHVDIANARLEFENGAVANVTASRVSRDKMRRIRVFSERHYLGLNFASQQLEEVAVSSVNGGKFPELVSREIDVTPQLPLNAELAHFVDCVMHNKTPIVTGEHGLNAVSVAQRVQAEIARSMSLQ